MSQTTHSNGRPVRALGLISGGADSRLAVCVIRDQDIRVEAVSFESPFFSSARARQAAAELGIPLHVLPFADDIISLVEHPPHGFGAGMNPCIDCHARMIRRAGELMRELGADFLFTGEILNQRPMSQNRRALAIVAEASGMASRLLRPLSAKLLPETEVERLGWVDRTRLLDMQGRSRREHPAIGARYGLALSASSGGGCCLTEPHFAARLRDLRRHHALREPFAVQLLHYGRHFRLTDAVICIVGRTEADNEAMAALVPPGALVLSMANIPGPLAILSAGATDEHILTAARLCARYSRSRGETEADVLIQAPDGASRTLRVTPATDAELAPLRIE